MSLWSFKSCKNNFIAYILYCITDIFCVRIISLQSSRIHLSSSRDIAGYHSNSTILLHINQPAYFMERNMENIYISRTTQRTNTGQVSACSQEPEDSTDANIVVTSTCLKTIR